MRAASSMILRDQLDPHARAYSAGGECDRDELSAEGRKLAAELAELAWKPIACWGAIKMHRAADDTHTRTQVEAYQANVVTGNLYLIVETYDGHVRVASIQTSATRAAEVYVRTTTILNPLRFDRGFPTKAYTTHEAIRPETSFARAVHMARRAS